jgi:hypothetical protein
VSSTQPHSAIGAAILHKDHSDDDSVLFGDHVIQLSSNLAQLPNLLQSFPKRSSFFFFKYMNMNSNELQITKITLPLSKFIEFMNSSFKCHSCNSVEGKIMLERYGIASSIYFDCIICGSATSCRAD